MTVKWLEPQPFGVDAVGNTHYLRTVGTHTVFGGTTGAGKTDAALGFVALGLLDPTVKVAVIDGKDDDDQWRKLEHFTGGMYVGGNTSASIAGVTRLLHDLLDLSNSRGSGLKGADEPYIVVVDEWYRIRQAAKRHAEDNGKEIDGLMADLASSVRSRHMHFIFCVQAGTVEFLPGDLGTNIAQRVQGVPATPAQVQYLIHSRPPVLPRKPGEFLVSSNEGGSSELVTAPFFAPAADQVFAAAGRLRAARPVVSLVKAEERPVTWEDRVQVILEEAAGPMTTKELLAALGDHTPTPYDNRLGVLLKQLPTLEPARNARGTRAWVLAEPAAGGLGGPIPSIGDAA